MKLDDETIIEELAEVEIVSVEAVKDADISELNDVSVGLQLQEILHRKIPRQNVMRLRIKTAV